MLPPLKGMADANGSAASAGIVPTFSLGEQPSTEVKHTPGISFDSETRVFRLRCKSSLYAFRVDDSRNLEHLYWGTQLLDADEIQYMTHAHVPTPFDPSDHVSVKVISKALTFADLRNIKTRTDMFETWKVATKQKDASKVHGRRLENVSWRLWNTEKRRGGDLNFDLASKMEQDAISMEDDQVLKKALEKMERKKRILTPQAHKPPSIPLTPPVAKRAFVDSPPTPSMLPQSALQPDQQSLRTKQGLRGMLSCRSVSHLAGMCSVEPGLNMGVAAKQEFERTGRLQPALQSTSSISTLASGDADTASISWSKLDPAKVGKSSKLLEYSDVGTGDYREPSFRVRFKNNGSTICPLTYSKHKIVPGKLAMMGSMPQVYTENDAEATTLIVDMVDEISKVKLQLYYSVMHNFDTIVRRTVVTNEGPHPVTIDSVASGTVDFDAEHKFFMTQLSGGWARERQIVTHKLEDGVATVKSCRGTSSHQFNPFTVIAPQHEPMENHGECFGFSFVYSGNFAITAEVSEYRRLRVNVGINPELFSWQLDRKGGKNCSFETPELIIAYSDEGMGKMSRDYHRLIRERIIPRRWRYKIPPVLLNTWEAVYFSLDHDIIMSIAKSARQAGIEMIVLDDGWFGKRNNVSSGLGDWKPNLTKLIHGIDGLAAAINKLGLKFGIWVEPEMVSLDSDMFRNNPDWCLCVPNRERTMGRQQFVLDFSRKAVVDHIYGQLEDLLSSANIEYIKWDMNRHLTDIFSQAIAPDRQSEVSHRYMLGVYECIDRITKRFPEVRFEMCSGGGGRFDLGMLYYSPQIWTSDNTDALSRTQIQYGSSLVYPLCSMGAHVSAVPNHQTRRTTTMKIRSFLAMSGTFGYELDPRVWNEKDIAEISGFINHHKRISPLVYEGDFYRIWSPFETDSCAWMFVSRNKLRGVAMAFNLRREVGRLEPRLKLRGLIPNQIYCVEELVPGNITFNKDTGAAMESANAVGQFGSPLYISGQSCMRAGIPVKFLFDGDSVVYEVNAVNTSNVRLM